VNDRLIEKLDKLKKDAIENQENDERKVDLYSSAGEVYEVAFDEGYWSGMLFVINMVLEEIK